MIDINVANFVTIGLITLAFLAVLKWALGAAGVSSSWF
jgi:hypothetical protein